MNDATTCFMELVTCEEWEVKDVPSYRIHQEPTYVPPERRQHGLGTTVIYFGKHKGRQIIDVPKDYLLWIVRQPPMDCVPGRTRQSIERTKRIIRCFLAEETTKKQRKYAGRRSPRQSTNHQGKQQHIVAAWSETYQPVARERETRDTPLPSV